MNIPIHAVISLLVFSPNRHVHFQCDFEASESYVLEKRLTQPNFMFVCKVCKGLVKSALQIPVNGNSNSGVSRLSIGDDSNEGTNFGDASSDAGDDSSSKIGIGKGKPFAAIAQSGKQRKRFGFVGRPRGGGTTGGASSSFPTITNWKGNSANKPETSSNTPAPSSTSAPTALASSIAAKKRLSEVRKKGRLPKIRGMVGLQVKLQF